MTAPILLVNVTRLDLVNVHVLVTCWINKKTLIAAYSCEAILVNVRFHLFVK